MRARAQPRRPMPASRAGDVYAYQADRRDGRLGSACLSSATPGDRIARLDQVKTRFIGFTRNRLEPTDFIRLTKTLRHRLCDVTGSLRE